MCTAITLKSKDNNFFIGRTMDIECSFHQQIMTIPRNFETLNKATNNSVKSKYAITAMGTLVNKYPLLADGFNECGLACCGLNFPNYAHYNNLVLNNKENVPAYDFVYYILSTYESIRELKDNISKINLINMRFNSNLPLPPLHFIVYDKSNNSLIIEPTINGLEIYDNNLGILSNSPNYSWHLTNLSQYIKLNNKPYDQVSFNNILIKPFGCGSGLLGLPGDFYPSSRFVRATIFKHNLAFTQDKNSTMNSFFHILDNLSMIDGSVITNSNLYDITLYKCVMNLNDKVYYYKTYNNQQINSIKQTAFDTNKKEITLYDFLDIQNINPQN